MFPGESQQETQSVQRNSNVNVLFGASNVQEAWLQTTNHGAPIIGTDVLIAIVDDGVQFNHEDLSINYVANSS